jgi:hypothetical protein
VLELDRSSYFMDTSSEANSTMPVLS